MVFGRKPVNCIEEKTRGESYSEFRCVCVCRCQMMENVSANIQKVIGKVNVEKKDVLDESVTY